MSWLLRILGIASRKDIDMLYRLYECNFDFQLRAASRFKDMNIRISELEKKKK